MIYVIFCFFWTLLAVGSLDASSASSINHTVPSLNDTGFCSDDLTSNNTKTLTKKAFPTRYQVNKCPPERCLTGDIPDTATDFVRSWRDYPNSHTPGLTASPGAWTLICREPQTGTLHTVQGKCHVGEFAFNSNINNKQTAVCAAGLHPYRLDVPRGVISMIRRARINAPNAGYFGCIELVLVQLQDTNSLYEAKYILLETEHHSGTELELPVIKLMSNNIRMRYQYAVRGPRLHVTVGLNKPTDEPVVYAYFSHSGSLMSSH